ncbi:MAG: sensor histidine kinase [Chloroflexota bacterium]
MALRTYRSVNKVRLPLFWKFAIAISITVLLFGMLNLLFIRYQVYRTFEAQIERNGLSIASITAEQLIEPILYNELASVNKILQQTKMVNPDIVYLIIVTSDDKVLAHTFENPPPAGLVNANTLDDKLPSEIKIIHSLSSSDTVIRDIAVPIMHKRLGVLRMGFSEKVINQQLRQASRMFIFLVIALLVLGILASFFLSYIISKPVRNMSENVARINLRSLESRDYGLNPPKKNLILRMKNMFNMTDEIDMLGNSFNEMLFRLNVAYIELEKTRESLSQTEKLASVGTLAAGLAHEINNPLAGIRNCLRRISEKPENITQNIEYMEMMSEAVDKINNVVKGLLDFSRKHEMNFSRINLIRHLENSISLLSFQIRQAGIQLNRNYQSQEIMMDGSPNHLEQVFVNLLLNSIEAIGDRKLSGNETIGIIDINVRKEARFIIIQITDNGIGLAKEKIPVMFDAFFTEKKIKPGTGLGLAVSADIIKNHHGTIKANNVESGGFIISIKFPENITI